ncbi:MAG: tandem-95 repeat protein, partial [Aquabacterium sp.]
STVLNRGNTNTGTAVFELQGADDVTLDHLSITGALTGVLGDSGQDSDRILVSNGNVWGNAGTGIWINTSNDNFTVRNSALHGNHDQGIYLHAIGGVIEGNDIYGNGQWGAYVDGVTGTEIRVSGNKVHDNTSGGITAYNNVLVRDNEVYSHLSSGRYGIAAYYYGAVVSDNYVHHNDNGIYLYSNAVVSSNEVYANTKVGVVINSATVTGNRIYSNSTGIQDDGYAQIDSNVIYANSNVGLSINSNHNGSSVRNNTLYQPVGDAILIGSNATDVRLYNNIVWVNAGYGINVANAGSLTQSDYNLFNTPLAGARVGLWAGVQQATLAAWKTASGKDAHSKAGDPLFLDIDGADNVLGEKGLVAGNGFDDNFGLRANSAAIDAGDMYHAPASDIDGLPRRDDPSIANTGDGLPLYVATPQSGSSFAQTGTKLNYRTGDSATTYNLPFSFRFYGQDYNSVLINTNGFLQFGSGTNGYGGNDANTLQGLINNVRIAPLWDDLSTYSGSDATRDIYVDSSVSGQLTIRWAAVAEGTNNPVNFSVTLFSNGSFRFDYGPSASGLTPTVGVSAGNGQTYVLSTYDGRSDLSSAASLAWAPTPGLNYYDIGAYEFLGSSNDATPPTVTQISQLPADGGTTAAAFTSLQIDFSEALDRISARSPANYELLSAGVDKVFGTPDDTRINLKPGYSFPETNLTLQLVDGVLAEGKYRLKLSGTLGIFDTAGNLLDGDGNGTAGGDYVREFTIDRASNQAPVATDATAQVSEGGSVLITLAGTDPNGDALSYTLLTQPQYGTLSDFDPATHTVRYTPSANFNGTDSFKFRVDDGKLGADEGTIVISVLPVNTAPTGAATIASTDEDTPVSILLPANDVETARGQLGFSVGTGPQHGSISQGPNGVWTYTPDADFFGTDSFTYVVTDRGDPDGNLGGALSSAANTVTVTVRPTNDGPHIGNIAAQTVAEGQTLSFAVPGVDPDGQALSYSLVGSVPAGASVHASTGVFTWKPADGASTQTFTVRVSDGTQTADASFNVNVTNVAPTLTLTGAATVDQGQSYAIAFSATDPGADTVSAWTINWGDGFTTTVAGSATGSTHAFAQGGNYSVTVTAIDEDGSYISQPLAVRVIAPNRAPVAPAVQTATTSEDQAVVITLAYSDPDNDALTVGFPVLPGHGTLGAFDPVTRQLTYTPAGEYSGSDSFQFRVADGFGGSVVATVNITVNPVDDAPVAGADSYTVKHGQSLAVNAPNGVLANDSDIDSASLSVVSTVQPANGTVIVQADGSFTYTPNAGFVGTDTWTYRVGDGVNQATGSVSVLVTNATTPVAGADSYATKQGQALTVTAANGVLANDSDADGDAITLVSSAQAAHGTLVVQADGSFVYTPDAGFTGTDTWTYRIGDGAAQAQGTVTIQVTSATPPVAGNDSYTVQHGKVLSVTAANGVLANDSDPNGGTLSLPAFTTPAHGTLALQANGSFVYTPVAGFVGSDSWTYTLSNGLTSVTGTVSLDVTNAAPAAGADAYTVTAARALNVTAANGLLANDTDADGDALILGALDTTGTQGTVTVQADGSFRFVPATGFTGSTSFKYTVSDGFGGSTQATVTIDVVTPLQVSSFEQTDSGFKVRFNRPVDTSKLNLYYSDPANMAIPDLMLIGPDAKAVDGSLILDADHAGFTFL